MQLCCCAAVLLCCCVVVLPLPDCPQLCFVEAVLLCPLKKLLLIAILLLVSETGHKSSIEETQSNSFDSVVLEISKLVQKVKVCRNPLLETDISSITTSVVS